MRFLRLILAALVALAVLVGGLIAAVFLAAAGVVGFGAQRLRRAMNDAPARGGRPPNRQPKMRTDDVIDI